MVRLDSTISTPDMVSLGSSSLIQSFGHLGSTMPVFGWSCFGLNLSVQSLAKPDLPLFASSRTTLDFSSSALDFALLELALFARSSTCLGFLLLALDFSNLDLLLLLRSLARLELPFLTFDAARCEPSVFVLDFLHLDFGPSVRSLAQMGFSVPMFSKA